MGNRCLGVIVVAVCAIFAYSSPGDSQVPDPSEPPELTAPSESVTAEEGEAGVISLEAAIINPYQSANVGTEVSGIIEMLDLGEGEFVVKDRIVAEISKQRYELLRQKAADALEGTKLALKVAEKERALKQEMLSFEGATKQELLKAELEAEIAKTRVEEAKNELKLAELNLEKCQVRAPYSGYIAVKYKQPFEPVERLEKIFAIVDSAKVYAVANLPETEIERVSIGDEATFVYAGSKRFPGKVEKIGKLIDPKSNTKRVFAVIDNTGGGLELGMTGVLQLPHGGKGK